MRSAETARVSRRALLASVPCAFAAAAARAGQDDGRPPVTDPRATAGDSVEPEWESRIEITVGRAKADLIGSTGKAIQAAVDYVAGQGGGTVRVLPGVYRLRNAVFLRRGVRILGSGADSVLEKAPMVKTTLASDSDHYEQEITLADANGFEVGDGVCFQVRSHRNQGVDVFTRTLVARSGNRFKLDRPLPGYPGWMDLWLSGNPVVTSHFSLLNGEEVHDLRIENITLDGNKAQNELINGNHAAALYLKFCNRAVIRRVIARGYNGDGIAWATSHDAVIEDCLSLGNEGLGLHAGSGSQRLVARRNRLEENGVGFYFCWGAKYGLLEDCTVLRSKEHGISLGHNDTDNLVRRNEIRESGVAGVAFRIDIRPENGRVAPPHRNRVEANRIVNNGGPEGIGIDVQGPVQDVTLARNDILETRAPMQRVGVSIAAESGTVRLDGNRIEGFSRAVSDQRASRPEGG